MEILSPPRRRSPVVRHRGGPARVAHGRRGLFASAYARMGSGIFLALGIVELHARGLAPAAILLAGLVVLAVAASYAEGISLFPEAGGPAALASLDTVPTALLNNAEHNGIVHERVVLVKIHTMGVPHVPDAQRVAIKSLRLGFVAVAAAYGYQDEPDVVAALRQAQRQGLEIDLDRTSYYVDHVTILPTGRARMAGWRKRLFAVLHQNSTPVARSYGIPPDRVFEVGAYVEL